MYTNWRSKAVFRTSGRVIEGYEDTLRFQSIMAPGGEVITGFDAVLEVGRFPGFHSSNQSYPVLQLRDLDVMWALDT
jgi:hypothetical protein